MDVLDNHIINPALKPPFKSVATSTYLTIYKPYTDCFEFPASLIDIIGTLEGLVKLSHREKSPYRPDD